MIDVSLFASANRPKWWLRLHDSLKSNRCNWEIVFVGDVRPTFNLPENFRWYYSDKKPSQCYAAASHLTKGRLIGWTCDDSVQDKYALDHIVDASTRLGKKFILTQATVENGKDVTDEHYLFRNCPNTPQMSPMGFMDREWFFSLNGYDRNYICGQAENSICLDAKADGGEVRLIKKSKVFINHEEVHGGFLNKFKYKVFGKRSFRKGYWHDRRYLEECYIHEGFGTYDEKTLKHGTISPKRLLPHHPYNYDNILTVAQGDQGRWGE